jgi:hypothetical protein
MGLSALSPTRRMSDLPWRRLPSGFAAGTMRTGLATFFFLADLETRTGFFAPRFFAGLDGFFFLAMTALGVWLWNETLKNDVASGKLCAMD